MTKPKGVTKKNVGEVVYLAEPVPHSFPFSAVMVAWGEEECIIEGHEWGWGSPGCSRRTRPTSNIFKLKIDAEACIQKQKKQQERRDNESREEHKLTERIRALDALADEYIEKHYRSNDDTTPNITKLCNWLSAHSLPTSVA